VTEATVSTATMTIVIVAMIATITMSGWAFRALNIIGWFINELTVRNLDFPIFPSFEVLMSS
jgi:hypothetical protein